MERTGRGTERKGEYRTWPWSTTGVHHQAVEKGMADEDGGRKTMLRDIEKIRRRGGSWDDEKREREGYGEV